MPILICTNLDGWVDAKFHLDDVKELLGEREMQETPNTAANEVGASKVVPDNDQLESVRR